MAGSVIAGNDAQSVRDQVNQNADRGANFIKRALMTISGRPKMPRAVFDALVDQAHSRRLPVAVHLFYLDDAKYMLEADADLIAHSIRDLPVDDEFIDAVSARGVLHPYADPGNQHLCLRERPGILFRPIFLKEADPAVLEALQTPERMSRMAASRSAQAYKAGLEVAMGNVGALHSAGSHCDGNRYRAACAISGVL